MKKLAIALLLFPLCSFAQVLNCDLPVADYAGILGSDGVKVADASKALVDQGADPRIVTVTHEMMINHSNNIDLVEADMERNCGSWQGRNGTLVVRKSTLLVLMVAPKERKKGIYYGSAFRDALDDHWQRIGIRYMSNRFATGDWAAGFIAGEQQFAARLAAAKDEAIKPVTSSTTINQVPPDYSGLWKVLFWIVMLAGCTLLGFVCYQVYAFYYKKKRTLSEARQRAIDNRHHASDTLGDLENQITTREAIGESVPVLAKTYLDRASRDFATLGNSVTTDPDTDGLDETSYLSMASAYGNVAKMAEDAIVELNGGQRKSQPWKPDPDAVKADTQAAKQAQAEQYRAAQPDQRQVPVHHGYTHRHTTVVNETVLPVIIDEPVYRAPEPEPSYTPAPSYSAPSDNGGGGSDSWSSSSDSGGGGGFDFGGSDSSSGGGGSDSF